MGIHALNKDKTETPEFTFKGDCIICAEGSGSIQLLRKKETGAFAPVTDSKGIPIVYAADNGLAFNGHISCDVRATYKIVATGEMIVEVRTEK